MLHAGSCAVQLPGVPGRVILAAATRLVPAFFSGAGVIFLDGQQEIDRVD
jgi:hypothetical protein